VFPVSFPLEKKTGVFGKEDERRWKMSQSEAEKSATSAGKNETLFFGWFSSAIFHKYS